jgi:hypothetical protein
MDLIWSVYGLTMDFNGILAVKAEYITLLKLRPVLNL